MIQPDWKRNGPNEEIATYGELSLKKKFVAGKNAYFIYNERMQLVYSTGYYNLFLQKVDKPPIVPPGAD